MRIIYLLTAAAAVGALAVPARAQQPYPYPYAQPVPQPYPGQPGYGYQQPGYGYPGQPGYGANPVEQIISQLLGNSTQYNSNDRSAVSRCATAALAEANRQYAPRYGRYGQQYDPRYANNGYNNGYSQMRVTAISNVERRRNNSLRVTGLIDSGAYGMPYGNAYGFPGQGSPDPRYADPRYSQVADLSFRCNVDYRGAVSSVRVNRHDAAYRR